MQKRKSSDVEYGTSKKVKCEKLAGSKTPNDKGKKIRSTSLNTSKGGDGSKNVKNFWWHGQKAKKLHRKEKVLSTYGKSPKSDNNKTSALTAVNSLKGSTSTEPSKKKALQLKKRRQKKNRLLKKRANFVSDEKGDIPRRPKSWTSPESSNIQTDKRQKLKNKQKLAGEKVTKPKAHHHRTENSVDDLQSLDLKQGGILASDGARQLAHSSVVSKNGDRKKHKRKKNRKVEKSGADDGKQVIGGKKELTDSTLGQGKTKVGKEKRRNFDKISDQEGDLNDGKVQMDSVSKTEVSSNWKTLLPIIEKSKEAHANWQKKSGRKTKQKPSKPDIWFDDVNPSLIRANENEDDDNESQSETTTYNPLIRKDAQDRLTKCLAMDCEMVGTGFKGSQSILARVSVVNQFGACVFDKYVKPREPVTDFRTFVSGIRPRDLQEKGEDFEKVQKELADLFKGRVVVGHALHNDFKVLYFNHPRSLIRDTSTYQPFRELFKSKRPGLKKLTQLLLKVNVQKGEHNSVEDAQAAMKLYLMHRKHWEKSLRETTRQFGSKKPSKKTKTKTPTTLSQV